MSADKYKHAAMKICDEILQFANGKSADGLKSKYAPKAVEIQVSAPGTPGGDGDGDELDADSLARLAQMAGE